MLKGIDRRNAIYIGTGLGLMVFVLLGFFPSAMVGGFVGLTLAKLMLGPDFMGVIAKVITAICMIGSVIITACLFVFFGALAGYFVAVRVGK